MAERIRKARYEAHTIHDDRRLMRERIRDTCDLAGCIVGNRPRVVQRIRKCRELKEGWLVCVCRRDRVRCSCKLLSS